METLELEPITEQSEKLLIFENHQEINRVRQEIESRRTLLNQIAKHGLSPDIIEQVTQSKNAIDDHIFKEQIKVNRELKKQYTAGGKNLQDAYELPENLKSLKYALLAWHSYQSPQGRHGDKFLFLTFDDQWRINETALENYLIGFKYKVYLHTEDEISEYNYLKDLCLYLEKKRASNNQIFSNSFFNDRIQCVGPSKFIPKWQYFKGNQ